MHIANSDPLAPPPAYAQAPSTYPAQPGYQDEKRQVSAEGGSGPVNYKIHRAAAGSSRDLFAIDCSTLNCSLPPIAYYFQVPSSSTNGNWHVTFHRGDGEGPVLIDVKKKYFSRHFELEVVGEGRERELRASSRLHYWHEFEGREGRKYEWKSTGKDLKCEDTETKEQVAYWSNVDASKVNEGSLEITPGAAADQELILATGFILQERRTEKAKRDRDAAVLAAIT